VAVALIFKKTLFRSGDVPFVMELPPYRMPTLITTTRHMWNKGSQYLKKMGGIILVASIIIWALGYFPRHRDVIQHDAEVITAAEQRSYIERIGLFIEPAIAPLGFDWKMGVALLSGVAAKEIVVSTMGVLYQDSPERSLPTESLGEKLRQQKYPDGSRVFTTASAISFQQKYPDGSRVFTTASAISFLVFILLYFPCVAVIAAIKNESGHWKWAAFAVLYTTGLAYIMSFIVYRIGILIF